MHYYLYLLSITTLSLFLLAIIVWRKHNVPGAHAFSLLIIALVIWSTGYFCEIRSPDFRQYLFWANFEYFGILLIPITWTIFVAQFTGKTHLLTKRNKILLLIEPAILLILVWTNRYHSLIWSKVSFDTSSSLRLAVYENGIGFWINAYYTYLILLIGSILFIKFLIAHKNVFRAQLVAILVGLLAPWILSFLYLFNLNPLPHFEITFLGFTITAFAVSLALLRYRFLDILPVAHKSLIEHMSDGLIVLDDHNRIIEINPAAKCIFSLPVEKILALPVSTALSDYPEFITKIQDISDGKAEVVINDHLKNRLIYELRISPLKNGTKGYAGKMVVLRDISERIETTEILKRRESILTAVRFAASEFMKGIPWEEVIPKVLKELGEVVQASRTYIFENHRNSLGELLTSKKFEWTAPGIQSQLENPELQNLQTSKAVDSRWSDLLIQGAPVFGTIDEFSEIEGEMMRRLGVLSLAIVPIFQGDSFWGFMGFDDCLSKRRWSTVEIDALKAAASTFGSSIQRQYMEMQLHERIASLDALYQTSLEITTPHDLPLLLRTIVARAVELIGGTSGGLYLTDPVRKEVTCMVSFRTKKDFSGQTLNFGEGAAGIVAQTGKPLIISDYRKWEGRSKSFEESQPFRSVLSAPLTWQDRVLGVIHVLHDIKTNQFSEKDLTLLTLFAQQAAVAIENARLFEIQKQRAKELGILYESSLTITKSLDLATVCQNSAEQLSRAVNSTSAYILTCDLTTGKTVTQAEYFSPEANPQERVVEIDKKYNLFNYPKSMELLRQGKPQVIRIINAEIDREDRLELESHGIKSALEVPMIISGRVLGFADIWESREDREWSDEEIRVCQTLANQAAIAIDNARLYQEIMQIAVTDMLTGVYNRRGLFEVGERELIRSRRSMRPLTAIMLDIDNFKHVNDEFSHTTGDQVLIELVRICKANLREMDILGRYGGEEFVILLPETECNDAFPVAERLRKHIVDTPIRTPGGSIQITVSMGISCSTSGVDQLSTLLDQADNAMYSAKNEGRNRIQIDHPMYELKLE